MLKNNDRAETAIFTGFEDYTNFDSIEPEKTLMAAILKTALEDLKKTGQDHRSAKEYLLSNDRNYLYSFANVCLFLGLCPSTVRALTGLKPSYLSILNEQSSSAS